MTRLSPAARMQQVRDSSISARAPIAATEFEVQATLWHGLRDLGFDARGEVKVGFAGRAAVRFDIAIFEDGRLVAVMECKREGKSISGWDGTRQGRRYGQFGVPVHLICGMKDAESLLARLEADMSLLY